MVVSKEGENPKESDRWGDYRRRGEWCGYPATVIAKFLGSSHTTARELMKSLRNLLGRDLEFNDIGELIQEYRNKRDQKLIRKFMK